MALALFAGCTFPNNVLLAQTSDTNIVNEPRAADDLRAAILRIGKRPTDGNALYDAGDASLRLGDSVVALDFFTRAERLSPASGRVKSGMARAQLNLENPIEALRLFDLAIALGESQQNIAYDRGLAFDLVGNFARAQQEYSLASSILASNELTIRQAISFSLSGNHDYADGLLLPLLRANNPSAWRARAFLLAARGKDKESYKIAQGFLPSEDAKNLRPYLKSMDKLTGAQQAAAVHFGHFPASNLIGRDSEDIRIAAQNSNSLQDAVNANRLKPKGTPLGKKQAEGKVASRSTSRESQASIEPKLATKSEPSAKSEPSTKSEPLINSNAQNRVVIVDDPDIRISRSAALASNTPKAAPSVNISSDVASIAGPKTASTENIAKLSEVPAKIAANPVGKTRETQAIAPVKTAALAKADNGNSVNGEAVFNNAAVTAPAKKQLDLQQFINSIEVPEEEKNQGNAVNLAAIKAEQRTKREEEQRALALKQAREKEELAARKKREEDKKAQAEKREKAKQAEAEKNKARYWVQIATGRDKGALKYDYRRISRKQSDLFSGKSALTSKWGSTNRLVVGPFDNLTAAKKFESAYRKAGGDGFVWRSGNGTIVTPLK